MTINSIDVTMQADASGNLTNIVTSGEYLASSYVAPFASVSGASSDEDIQTQTAFDNSSSIGTPCTLACAHRFAVAGDIMECAVGNYTGAELGTDTTNYVFSPTTSGTALLPIIFYALYPAAYNYGSTSLYSKLIKTGADVTGTSNDGSMIGPNGTDYIIYDGFYVEENLCPSGVNAGIFGLRTTTGSELRRLAFNRNLSGYANGFNGNCIYTEPATNCVITDCLFEGAGLATNHNDAAIETYSAPGLIIEHCKFNGGEYAIYIKGESTVRSNGVIIRYNWIDAAEGGVVILEFQNLEMYENLILGSSYCIEQSAIGTTQVNAATVKYNTCILTGTWTGGVETCMSFPGSETDLTGSDYHSNIFYNEKTTSLAAFMDWTDSTPYTDMEAMARIDNNVYYDTSAGYKWNYAPSGTYTDITTWKTELATFTLDDFGFAYEHLSLYSDPEFVGSGDYSLAANAQSALTAGLSSTEVGCYTNDNEIGLRVSPTY